MLLASVTQISAVMFVKANGHCTSTNQCPSNYARVDTSADCTQATAALATQYGTSTNMITRAFGTWGMGCYITDGSIASAYSHAISANAVYFNTGGSVCTWSNNEMKPEFTLVCKCTAGLDACDVCGGDGSTCSATTTSTTALSTIASAPTPTTIASTPTPTTIASTPTPTTIALPPNFCVNYIVVAQPCTQSGMVCPENYTPVTADECSIHVLTFSIIGDTTNFFCMLASVPGATNSNECPDGTTSSESSPCWNRIKQIEEKELWNWPSGCFLSMKEEANSTVPVLGTIVTSTGDGSATTCSGIADFDHLHVICKSNPVSCGAGYTPNVNTEQCGDEQKTCEEVCTACEIGKFKNVMGDAVCGDRVTQTSVNPVIPTSIPTLTRKSDTALSSGVLADSDKIHRGLVWWATGAVLMFHQLY